MLKELHLTRAQLQAICGNDPRAIATLEKVVARTDATPTTIEEAAAQANQAIAMAVQALALVAELSSALEAISANPASIAPVVNDDPMPVRTYVEQAGSLTDPSTFPAAATDLPTVIALANAIRIAAINKGL